MYRLIKPDGSIPHTTHAIELALAFAHGMLASGEPEIVVQLLLTEGEWVEIMTLYPVQFKEGEVSPNAIG